MSSGSEIAVVERVTAAELLQRSRDALRGSEHETARALAQEAADRGGPAERAEALCILATCRRLRDEYPEAIEAALRATELCREIGDPSAEARARSEVARALTASGETDEALGESLAALELAEAGADLGARIAAMTAVANVYLVLQQHDLAIELCERGAEMARLLGDEIANGALQDTVSCALLMQSQVARTRGDEQAAVQYSLAAAERSQTAMAIAREHGHRRNEACALGNLAEALASAGQPAHALALLDTWEIDPGRDSAFTITHHLDTRGGICVLLGRYEEAIALFSRALDVAESKGSAMMYCEHLAEAYEKNGDFAAALATYKRFHLLYCEVASEAAQRNARLAAVRLETEQAKASAERERLRADGLQRLSLEDPLTGLANRRRLDNELAAGVAGHTIALIDVDHFKRVNDGFSHQIGDEVLRELGRLLRSVCRADDLAARYGGEEFAVLFRGLTAAEAAAAAERIRRAVEEHDWSVVAEGLTVTVSIGVASGGASTPAAGLISLADQRLYEAKHAGRNRVRVSTGST
ncbi:diguanylate cyclase [Actinoplanes sp. KI2]|uniref:tetratricopeptide repeat-containing diguanylate cyclase n=1 Tax=Actinoplanes sp. KI2 TaxID=2983315 RepID=UPI0021D58FA1|nr:tetratricopeptide repeat-containing diguanylate cyclase [Actinoplanes sp. KI2]MCU7726465.1 diguanylate cyclase [Actinoplanes sp. KI2]